MPPLSLLLAAASAVTVPLSEGWYRGRRARWYQFDGVARVLGDAPRLYRLLRDDAAGSPLPFPAPRPPDVADVGPGHEGYTGLWYQVDVILPFGAASPPESATRSAADLTAAAAAGGWRMVPSGSFLHCPFVASGTALERPSDMSGVSERAVMQNGVALTCLSLGTVLSYPSRTGALPDLWNLRRLPNLIEVPGNDLVDWRPTQRGYSGVFARRAAQVSGGYEAGAATSAAQLAAMPHVAGSDARVVTLHVVSVEPPAIDLHEWQRHVVLDSTAGASVEMWWSVLTDVSTGAPSEVLVKLRAEAAGGWLAVGFGQVDPAVTGRAQTEMVVAYESQTGKECFLFAHTGQSDTQPAQIGVDNVLSVQRQAVETDVHSTTVLWLSRRATGARYDSEGVLHPNADILASGAGRLVWATRSTAFSEETECAATAAQLEAGLLNPVTWHSRDVVWVASGTPAPTTADTPAPPPPTPPPPAPTPFPGPSGTAVARGSLRVSTQLLVEWDTDAATGDLLFTLRYTGDLRGEGRWMGIGFGAAFTTADIVIVWHNRNGTLVVDDRKSRGVELPPRDEHQDVVLLPVEAADGETAVRFKRKPVTGDRRTSVQRLSRAPLAAATLRRFNGWYNGRTAVHYTVDTPGGPFTNSVPHAAPAYVLVPAGGASDARLGADPAIPGQRVLVDSLPGQAGYADLRRIVAVEVPQDYSGAALSWLHDVPVEWVRTDTGRVVNCPIVAAGTRLEALDDAMRLPRHMLWYRGEAVWCLEFVLNATVGAPFAWGPATAADGTLFSVTPGDASYSGVWHLTTLSADVEYRTVSALPAGAAGGALWQGRFANRPIAELRPLPAPPPTPSPTPPPRLTHALTLHATVGESVVLHWTADADAGTLQVEVTAELPSAGGYVSIGFSSTDTVLMQDAEVVLGYVDPNSNPCVRVLRAVDPRGPPGFDSTLQIHNTELSFAGGVMTLKFTRGFDGGGLSQAKISTDPDAVARVLYAVRHRTVNVLCGSVDRSQFWHESFPHGSAEIKWLLPAEQTAGGSGGSSGGGAVGLPYALRWLRDGSVGSLERNYSLAEAVYEGAPIQHYVFDSGADATRDLISAQKVYAIVWPAGMRSIIDFAPGETGYSDLLERYEVRFPDGYSGRITSKAELDAEMARYSVAAQETGRYQNCPVVPAKTNFEKPVSGPDESPELIPLWYKSQELYCANFGNVPASTMVGRMYLVKSQGASEAGLVLIAPPPAAPSSLPHPFVWVQDATLPAGTSVASIRTEADLLASGAVVTVPTPPRVLNTPTPASAAAAASPNASSLGDVLPVRECWVDGVKAYYVDAGTAPVSADGSPARTELLVFRREGEGYWGQEVRQSVAAVLSAGDALGPLWTVTVVEVPATAAPDAIQTVTAIPQTWRRVQSVALLNCPVVPEDTQIAAYPDSGARVSVPRLRIWSAGRSVACLKFGDVSAAQVSIREFHVPGSVSAAAPAHLPVTSSITGSSLWLSKQKPYTLPASGWYSKPSEVPASKEPWSALVYNWPIVAFLPAAAAVDRTLSSAVFAGLHDGADVEYWQATDTMLGASPSSWWTGVRSSAAPAAEPHENFAAPTGPVYVFRSGHTLSSPAVGLDPVFTSGPARPPTYRDAKPAAGYSDIHQVVVVDVPAGAALQPRSEAEVLATNWTLTATTGKEAYAVWPLCANDSQTPGGSSLLSGWADGQAVLYASLAMQASPRVGRVYRTRSGRLAFPYLPGDDGFSAINTIWEAPTAPDAVTVTDLRMLAPSLRPAVPRVARLISPVSGSASGGGGGGSASVKQVYRRLQGRLEDGRRVSYYRIQNAPPPVHASSPTVARTMPARFLRRTTAYGSRSVQSMPAVPAVPGNPEYSDLHEVMVTEIPDAVAGGLSLPLTSVEEVDSSALLSSLATTATGLYRYAPAVHPDSELEDEVDRGRYPKAKVWRGGEEMTVLDFGLSKTTQPLTANRVVGTDGREEVIFSPTAPAPGTYVCVERVVLAPAGASSLTAISPTWTKTSCSDRGQGDCPLTWCRWEQNACRHIPVSYVCPIVHAAGAGEAELQPVSITALRGWYEERKVRMYMSPNLPNPDTRSSAYVFRSAADGTTAGLTSPTVPGLLTVFSQCPGAAGYSDLHSVHVVSVPAAYSGGAVRSVDDVRAKELQGWTVEATGVVQNLWVVHSGSSLSDKSDSAARVRQGFCDGAAIAYADFGSVSHVQPTTVVYNPTRTGEKGVGGGGTLHDAVLVTIPADMRPSATSPQFSPLVREVRVPVADGTTAKAASALSSLPQASGVLVNLAVVAADPPISPTVYDDVDINIGEQWLLWAYGPLEPATLLPGRCEARGGVQVDLTSPPPPSVSVSAASWCARGSPTFGFCWRVADAAEFRHRRGSAQQTLTGQKLLVLEIALAAGSYGSLGLSSRPTLVNGADVWVVYHDGFETHVTDRVQVGPHVGLPLADAPHGGTSDLELIQAETTPTGFNVTVARPLSTGDSVADVPVLNESQWLVWATGSWHRGSGMPLQHTDYGSYRVNLLTGDIEVGPDGDVVDQWWIPLSVCIGASLLGTGALLTRCSPKNSARFHSLVCKGSPKYRINVAQLMLLVSFLFCVALWIGMASVRYSDQGRDVAGLRGVGSGAVLCFSLLLLPVTRFSPILWAFGTTVRHAARWHVGVGVVLCGLVLVHGLGMVTKYGWDALRWESGDATRQPGLAGFIAGLSLLGSTGLAWWPCGTAVSDSVSDGNDCVRRRHREAFVVGHLGLGITALVFAALHHPQLVNGVLASLVLLVIDWGWRVWLRCAYGGAGRAVIAVHPDGPLSVQSIVHDDSSVVSVVALEVKLRTSDHACCDPFHLENLFPLQYVQVNVPAVSGWEWHPLAITCKPLHTEVDSSRQCNGEATTTFTLLLQADRGRPRQWSARVAALLRRAAQTSVSLDADTGGGPRAGPAIRVVGPFGKCGIDLRRYEHLLLIGGGVGGGALMSVLEYFLDRQWGDPSGRGRCRVISLVWAAKRRELFDCFAAASPPGPLRAALDLPAVAEPVEVHKSSRSNENFNFRLQLYDTESAAHSPLGAERRTSASKETGAIKELQDTACELLGPSARFVFSGRPTLWRDGTGGRASSDSRHAVFDWLHEQNEAGNPDSSLQNLEGRVLAAVGVVCCGPASMRRDVTRSVDKLNSLGALQFHLHAEPWD